MALKRAALGHVVLNVRDLKKSERFYREILGMKVSGRNQRTKMSFLSFGREHHDIALPSAFLIPTGTGSRWLATVTSLVTKLGAVEAPGGGKKP